MPCCSPRWQDFGKSLRSAQPRGQRGGGGGELASSCESKIWLTRWTLARECAYPCVLRTVTSTNVLNQLTKAGTRTSPAAKLRIFDCDVHPVPNEGLTSLTPYLPKAWKERFDRKQAIHDGLNLSIRHPNGSVVRQDARTPDGERSVLRSFFR